MVMPSCLRTQQGSKASTTRARSKIERVIVMSEMRLIMAIEITDPIAGTTIIRPAEFEESIRRKCRRIHGGIGFRGYVTKNRTRILVRPIR